jgi:hypothetical protein
MSYLRVIPRDLFNEAKLLKCLGQLSLFIHDRPRLGLTLTHEAEELGFCISQNEASGALYCENLELTFRGRLIGLSTPYNSKDAYPLNFVLGDEQDGRVFDENGEFSEDFKSALATLKK